MTRGINKFQKKVQKIKKKNWRADKWHILNTINTIIMECT